MLCGKTYGDNKEYQSNGQRSPLRKSLLLTWEIQLWNQIKEVPGKKKKKGTADVTHQIQENLNVIQTWKEDKNIIK